MTDATTAVTQATEGSPNFASLEELLKRGWERSKRVFIPWLISLGISTVAFVALVLVALFLVGGAILAKSWVLAIVGILGIVVLALILAGFLNALTIGIVIHGGQKPFEEIFRMAKSKTGKFVITSIVVLLFFIGLAVFFVIPLLPWIVWALFLNFVVFEYDLSGFKALAKSKAIASGKFWKVLGYFLLVYIASQVFLGFFNRWTFGGWHLRTATLNDLKNLHVSPLGGLYWPLSMLVGLYISSFLYELYLEAKKFAKEQEEKVGAVWLILSALGWLLLTYLVLRILKVV